MNYLELARLAAPEIALVVTALAVLTIGLTKNRLPGLCAGVSAAGLLFAAAAVLLLPAQASLLQGMFVLTPLVALFKIICLALAFGSVLLAAGEPSLGKEGEYFALLLFATVGLLLLVGSEELLMIFIGLELTGLSFYVLTAFDRRSERGAEAGLKYFLFGSTASAFTLFGLSLIYGLTGTTALGVIAQKLPSLTPLLAAGLAMTLIGFAFKIAAVPFHFWAPDTYEGAPISTAAFIASGSKVASFFILGKLLLVAFGALAGSADWGALAPGWVPILAALAALSILVGNCVALVQKNVRRLLAYSAVAHGGYTLLGVLSPQGFAAALFYTTIYGLTLVGAFGVVAFVRRETGGDALAHFAGLRARAPLPAACMAIFLLSLAGLPPLAGFFGKFYLFSVALRAGPGLLWLVALALFGSLISLYYYLIVLKVIFLEAAPAEPASVPLRFWPGLILVVLAGAILLLGVLPQPLLGRILAALS